jgi:hypothetical protein
VVLGLVGLVLLLLLGFFLRLVEQQQLKELLRVMDLDITFLLLQELLS